MIIIGLITKVIVILITKNIHQKYQIKPAEFQQWRTAGNPSEEEDGRLVRQSAEDAKGEMH